MKNFMISIVVLLFLMTMHSYFICDSNVLAQLYGGAIADVGVSPPATCKDIGTLFWDTDNDRLYICDPANTWTEAGGVTLLDEDDFESNSDTQGATQQSIKAYTDSGLSGKANVSVVGTSLNSDDLLNNGGTLETQPEIPHIDAIQTWTAVQTFMNITLSPLSTEPSSPVAGVIYLADGIIWDPSGLNISKKYYVVYDGTDYIALFDEDGAWHLAYIPVPTYETDELEDDDGTPGATPYTLVSRELKGSILSNSGASGAEEYDFPARGEGWNFIFIKETDQNVTLEPNGSENWYFRTDNSAYTANGAGTSIVNTTSGKSTISCFSTESAVYCTGDANWAQGS